MDINDKNTPAEYPANELTQMIEAVAQRNRAGGSLPPSLPASRGSAISAVPAPTVRSADLGQPVQQKPLTIEERAELDRMAVASGMVRGPVTPGIAAAAESQDDLYGSLEDAIRAGAPVGADADAVEAEALRHREPVPVFPQPVGARSPRMTVGRQTAREFIAADAASQLPRLPDFRKVQMIDLINSKIYVDGLEFVLTKEQLQMLRKFCVTTAKEQIQKSLADALAAFDAEGTDGATPAV